MSEVHEALTLGESLPPFAPPALPPVVFTEASMVPLLEAEVKHLKFELLLVSKLASTYLQEGYSRSHARAVRDRVLDNEADYA